MFSLSSTVGKMRGSYMLLLLFTHLEVSDSFATPWTVAWQVSLSMGFPRQKYWSDLPLPSLGDLPNSGIKPSIHLLHLFLWQECSLPLVPPGKPMKLPSSIKTDNPIPWGCSCLLRWPTLCVGCVSP